MILGKLSAVIIINFETLGSLASLSMTPIPPNSEKAFSLKTSDDVKLLLSLAKDRGPVAFVQTKSREMPLIGNLGVMMSSPLVHLFLRQVVGHLARSPKDLWPCHVDVKATLESCHYDRGATMHNPMTGLQEAKNQACTVQVESSRISMSETS